MNAFLCGAGLIVMLVEINSGRKGWAVVNGIAALLNGIMWWWAA